MALTLRQIDAFRAVMLTGTLTEAAVHLGISQPAISRLIADMEIEIGYNLFERTGRRVVATAEAEILIDEVKRALIGLDQIKEAALEIGKFRYARLRLLAIPFLSSRFVTDLVRVFTVVHPETFISLDVRTADSAVDWVLSQQCDLGIVSGIPEGPAYFSKRLMAVPARCLLPRSHALASRPLITSRDLAGESFISFRPDIAFRGEVDRIFDRQGVERILRYEARTAEVICEMVASGMGVSLVGPLSLDGAKESGDLVTIPFESAPTIDLSLIWTRHRPMPAMAAAFIAVIEAHLKG